MGKFDSLEKLMSVTEKRSDFSTMERLGDSEQGLKKPKRNDVDEFSVNMEFDTVTPDMLLNMCKGEPDREKHVLFVFYSSHGKNEWIPVAMPRLRARKYSNDLEYVEVVDCRNGRRKTFKRSSIRKVVKKRDDNGGWMMYSGLVDKARFK